ncbi:MAG TPA: hypothetical protein VJH24_04100 [Candidatus Bilamarchaeaceae archaeon]|nr:hypothetical protein [Candidatus Bilamarchaeaceae archaeon]
MAEEKKKEGKPAAKKERQTKPYTRGKFCPKCGSGVTLARHKERLSCGRCGYFEKR